MEIQNIALITGGFRGLGLEWGRQLLQKGYAVILTGRSAKQMQEIQQIPFYKEKENDIFLKLLDITNEKQIEKLSKEIEEEFDKLDVLINNAGVNARSSHPDLDLGSTFSFEDFSSESMLEIFKVNTIAPALMIKYFLPLLRQGNSAKVLNISSWLGSITGKLSGGNYGYSSSKAALNMLSRAIALDLKRQNIITVAVNPGWVQTAMGGKNADLTPEQSIKGMIENVLEKITLKETGEFWQWDGTRLSW